VSVTLEQRDLGSGVSVRSARVSISGDELAQCGDVVVECRPAVAGARERLWVTTAFFGPPMLQILVNGPHIDKEVLRRAAQRSYDRLLECGVRIFEYQRTMLHAKTLMVDGTWASIGSNNSTNRSLALNSELSFSLSVQRIVAELEQHFRDDLELSNEPTSSTSRPGELAHCASGSSSERSLQYATCSEAGRPGTLGLHAG